MAMTRKGVDYSYARPTGAQLKAAGINAAMRYITDPGSGNKGITWAEWQDLGNHGVAIGLVWELDNEAALQGFAQGVTDATRAQHNLNALAANKGGPSAKRPLYFAVDFDATPSKVKGYFQGVVSVIGLARTGVYGSGAVLDYLFTNKLASFGWYVKVASAWGGGHVPKTANVHVQQIQNGVKLGSGTVDMNQMRSTGNWGQKAVILSKPAPKPIPIVPKPDPAVYYTIKAGDTLTKIAAKYSTTTAHLENLNPTTIADADEIYAGQRIRVR